MAKTKTAFDLESAVRAGVNDSSRSIGVKVDKKNDKEIHLNLPDCDVLIGIERRKVVYRIRHRSSEEITSQSVTLRGFSTPTDHEKVADAVRAYLHVHDNLYHAKRKYEETLKEIQK